VAAWTVTRRAVSMTGILAWVLLASACDSIDPGTNFVVPPSTFDPDYFYCHVEPQYIFAYSCGPGAAGDNNSCHYSSAVTGMALVAHPPIDCGGGDHPLDATQITTIAQSDYSAVQLEMSTDWMNAPLYVRPLGNDHPRAIFTSRAQVPIQILSTWANTQ
jgi:hypothetical protein